MQWADYSAGRPSGAALKAAGFGGVIRYVGLGTAGKRITPAEYQDLVASGVQVLLVAERDTSDAWNGYAAGVTNAQAALADARACGIPDSVGIAACADAHAQSQQQIDSAVQYARGFQDVLGKARTGFYGFVEVLNAVKAAGVGSWYWRCGAEPSGTTNPNTGEKAWVNFWQRNYAPTIRTVQGVVCDINEQYNPVSGGNDVNLSDIIPVTNGTEKLGDITVGDALGRIAYELTKRIPTRATINFDPKNADTLLGRATAADGNSWDNGQRLVALTGKVDSLTGQVAGLISAVAAATTNPAITPAFVEKTIQDAVAQHIQITGTVDVHATPAATPTA